MQPAIPNLRNWRPLLLLLTCCPGPVNAQLVADDLAACGSKPAGTPRVLKLRGDETAFATLPASTSRLLAVVRERGVDVQVSMADAGATVADAPVRREGTQLLMIAASPASPIKLRVRGKGPANLVGTVTIVLLSIPTDTDCAAYVRDMAAGDLESGAAELLIRGNEAAVAERPRRSRNAADAYSMAEATAIRMASPALTAQAQLALASISYQGLSEWARSQAAALRSIETLAPLNRPYFEARAAGMAGAAMLESGTGTGKVNVYQEARGHLERAVQVFRVRGDVYDEALQRSNIGLSYLYSAEFDNCIAESQRAIPLFQKLEDPHRVALTQQNIALCQWGQGNLRQAAQTLDRVAPILEDAPLPINYTTALNNAALVHYSLGEFDKSILQHAEAERVARQAGLPRERAQSLYGLGVNYAAIGDFATAEEYLERSLELRSAELDRRGRIASLRALASVMDAQRDPVRANEADQEAQTLAASELIRLRIESRILERSINTGQITPALRARLDELAKGVKGGDRLVVARAHYLRGLVGSVTDNSIAAYSELEAARVAFADLERIEGEYDACLALARFAHGKRDFARARDGVNCTSRLTSQMREQILSPELRADAGQMRRDAADLEVLIALDDPSTGDGRAWRTLLAMEKHRARLLDDYSNSDLEAGADSAELRRLYDDLATARAYLAYAQTRGSADTARAAELRRRVTEQRLAVLRAEDRLRSDRDDAAPKTFLKDGDLRRIDPGTAIVEYWLGESRAIAVVLTRDGVRAQELGTTQAIDKAVRELRVALRDASRRGVTQRQEKIGELSALVYEPLRLPPGLRRVVFVPDGSLHYVPMHALCQPGDGCGKALVERHDIAFAPSVNRLLQSTAAQPKASARVLIVADPVYQPDDPRLRTRKQAKAAQAGLQNVEAIAQLRSGSSFVSSLRRLPATQDEAMRIAAHYRSSDIDLLQGLTATRDKVLSLDLSRYGVIHFAVHGLSDDELPQLSALALTRYTRDGRPEDGRLWAGDLLQRRFNARLVFLSACDTALGPRISGEGLIGLNYVLISRGARSVISSLWPVEDVRTSELVAGVYTRLQQGEAVDAALTGAQRAYLAKSSDRDIRNWAAWSTTVGSIASP